MGDAGFSLVELLVALTIFSLAALALLESQGRSLNTASELELRTLAGFVADNRVAEFLGSRMPPQAGRSNGTMSQLGAEFEWRENRVLIREADMVSLTVTVSLPDGGEYARLTAFRRAN